jgi:pre-mRNA-processing factor 8
LYNSKPRSVEIGTYHVPAVMFVKNDEPFAEPFKFDETYNPISAYMSENMKGSSEIEIDDEEFDFELSDPSPLVEEYPLFTENTNSGINLYWAPRPFN